VATDLRSVARESAHLMDGGWYTVPFLRAFIDEDDATVFEEADATYIAAASPDVILGLLDRIAELEENQRPSDGYCPAARHHRVESRNAARMLGFNDAEEMEYGPEEVTSDRCTACGFDFAARSSSKVETAAGDSAK
jgi:hypothetical protein